MTTRMPAAVPRGQRDDLCPNPASARGRVDRWELLALVTHLRTELGLADRDVMVLRAHLSVLPHGPLDPNGLNVSFMNVAEILDRACGMDERRFRRGESRLEQVGLIRRRLSGNGRRFPERDAKGRIVSAYGIDLAPLLARRLELAALAEAHAERQRVMRQRKNSLSARLSAALRDLAEMGIALPHWIDETRETFRRIVRRKAPARLELDRIEDEIARIEAMVPTAADEEMPVDISAATPVSPDKFTADDGQTVRHIESKPKEEKRPRGAQTDIAHLALRWNETVTLRELFPDPPRSAQEALKLLHDFSSFMKLDRDIIGLTLSRLGWADTFITLDYLSEKLNTLRHPNGYLRSMIAGFERGETVAGGRVSMVR